MTDTFWFEDCLLHVSQDQNRLNLYMLVSLHLPWLAHRSLVQLLLSHFDRGDLHASENTWLAMQVHVRVEIPTKLSKDERKIIDELKEIQASKPVKKKGFSLF